METAHIAKSDDPKRTHGVQKSIAESDSPQVKTLQSSAGASVGLPRFLQQQAEAPVQEPETAVENTTEPELESEEAVQAKALSFIQRQDDDDDAVQAKALSTIQRQDEDEDVQAKALIQRQDEDEDVQAKALIQRQDEDEDVQAKALMQRQDEDEDVQAKALSLVQRQDEDEEAVQAKLKVGHPNDIYEQEADQMADLVTRQSPQASGVNASQAAENETMDPGIVQSKPLTSPLVDRITPWVQRQAEAEVEDDADDGAIQQKCSTCESDARPTQSSTVESEEEEMLSGPAQPLQRRPSLQKEVDGSLSAGGDISARLHSSKGSGQPLAGSTRSHMESSFGADFSAVRIHTDSESTALNKDLGAQAFTHGSDIYFNDGKYNPSTTEGQHLLAHELTHTFHQGASTRRQPDPAAPSISPTIQRREEYEGNKELAASRQSAQEATDPTPAREAHKQAEQEGQTAEKAAEASVPELPSPPPEPAVESPKAKQRVADPKPGKPSEVKPPEHPKGEVGQALDAVSASVCSDGAADAQRLANNESAHDTAAEKRQQTEAAVVPPADEGQSRFNANQVALLDDTPSPESDPDAMRAELNQAVEDHAPSNLDELNNFEPREQAKVMGSKVAANTQSQVGAVQGTYKEIENAPSAPAPEPSEPLPQIEQAPKTPTLNLGNGVVPDLQDEQVDFSEYEQQADDIYVEEGVGPDLQMEIEQVQDGELGEANQERSALDENVANQPQKLKDFATEQQQHVETELQQDEAKSRGSMQAKRKQGLEAAQTQQQTTKSKIELKREQVKTDINNIYELAKTKVNTKLESLEKVAMATFDREQTKYAAQFERDTKRDIDTWKEDRYSGVSGAWTWLKDLRVEVGDLPGARQIFKRHRIAFIENIDGLINQIDKDNQNVIDGCKQDLVDARKKIEEYLAGLDPEVRKTGEEAQKATQKKLAKLDQHIEKEKEKLQQALCDKKDEAIAAIDQKIEAMKEEMAGALAKLGNLLLNAAVKFFKWALEKAGLNPAELMNVINKGKAVLKTIVTDPIGFLSNLISGVKQGLDNFEGNIWNHLQTGLVEWLTGAMGSVGIQIPEDIFSLPGIFDLVMQILGLTKEYFRKKAVTLLTEPVVEAIEKTSEVFLLIREKGVMGLWEHIKDQLNDLKESVIGEIKTMVITEVIKAGVKWISALLNPASAIVKAAMLIYDVVMFFINQGSQIVSLVKALVNGIAAIASGSVGAVAQAIESALARALPVAIGFLAAIAGVSGLAGKVQEIVKKIRARIDAAIEKILLKVKKLFKGKKNKSEQPKDTQETKAKVDAGLKTLHREEKKYLKNNKITQEDAQKVASSAQSKNPIFSSITVIDGGEDWDYSYKIQREEEDGPGKADGDGDDPLKKAVSEGYQKLSDMSVHIKDVSDLLKKIQKTYAIKSLDILEEEKDEDDQMFKVVGSDDDRKYESDLVARERPIKTAIDEVDKVIPSSKYKEIKPKLTEIKRKYRLGKLAFQAEDTEDSNVKMVWAKGEYGDKFDSSIERQSQKFKKEIKETTEEEKDLQSKVVEMLERADHFPASEYKKHTKGKTNEERQENSKHGNGQYFAELNDNDIERLEKTALINADKYVDKNSVIYAYKTFSNSIGFSAPSGEETRKIRAEITNAPVPRVHSHPEP